MKGRVLGISLMAATALLITIGTVWPNQSGASVIDARARMEVSGSSPEAAVNNLLVQIGRRNWEAAYAGLANKGEFSEPEFIRDVGLHMDWREIVVAADAGFAEQLHDAVAVGRLE